MVKNTDPRTIRTIEELVVKTIEGSNLARSHGQELSFVLPNTEIETFPLLFKKVKIFYFYKMFLNISSSWRMIYLKKGFSGSAVTGSR